jgi:hypothetical protein
VDLCVENYEFSKHDPVKMLVNLSMPHEFGAYTDDTLAAKYNENPVEDWLVARIENS